VKTILISILFLGLVSCTSHPVNEHLQTDYPAMGTESYNRLIKKYTKQDKKYQFLDNNYIVKSTILNNKVKKAIINRSSHALQLPLETVRKKYEEQAKDHLEKSEFFVSFYAPIAEHMRLTTSDLWKVYLDTGGQRFEGVPRKVNGPLASIRSLYYFHNRFSMPYTVEFKVPMATVEKSDSYLIITGTMGSTRMHFPPMK